MRIFQVRRRHNIAENDHLAVNAFRCLVLFIKGGLSMSVRPKTGSRSFATRTVLGLAVLCLACPSASRAQCVSAPANSVTLQDQGTVSIYPFVWAPGHSYTVTITGTYPTGFGAPTYCLGLSAWQWPDYPDYYQVGGYDSNIQISNPTWVSPTVTTFDVSVNSNAPTGKDFLELQVPGGEDFWGILIQPPPAPTQPSPPPPAPCATPALDPTNPVTPDTWIPGKTYNITVKGTGFTTQAASSLPQCPATTITVSCAHRIGGSFEHRRRRLEHDHRYGDSGRHRSRRDGRYHTLGSA